MQLNKHTHTHTSKAYFVKCLALAFNSRWLLFTVGKWTTGSWPFLALLPWKSTVWRQFNINPLPSLPNPSSRAPQLWLFFLSVWAPTIPATEDHSQLWCIFCWPCLSLCVLYKSQGEQWCKPAWPGLPEVQELWFVMGTSPPSAPW